MPDGREEVKQEVETVIKYQRYIEKEQEVANRILKFEDIPLPTGLRLFYLTALSYECREKLSTATVPSPSDKPRESVASRLPISRCYCSHLRDRQ